MQDHIRFNEEKMCLELLDQRLLPTKKEIFSCRNTDDIIYALKEMVVRGAPAIGVTAAFGCVLAAEEIFRETGGNIGWQAKLLHKLEKIAYARPTAVNLSWAVKRMQTLWQTASCDLQNLTGIWLAEACLMQEDDVRINKQMGTHGAKLISTGDCVMTHCNAGALATAGFGTALGVIYAASEAGKKISVIANETRPFLQGARLTAYELHAEGIPVHVACDNACGLLMSRKMVQKVVVGADRIAANGDTANKIGTYSVALLAKAHNIPFYVAAPLSTIDLKTLTGNDIPIEERPAREVTHVGSVQLTPDDVPVYNFAFDITPHHLISGIITEKGILEPPFDVNIKKTFGSNS